MFESAESGVEAGEESAIGFGACEGEVAWILSCWAGECGVYDFR